MRRIPTSGPTHIGSEPRGSNQSGDPARFGLFLFDLRRCPAKANLFGENQPDHTGHGKTKNKNQTGRVVFVKR